LFYFVLFVVLVLVSVSVFFFNSLENISLACVFFSYIPFNIIIIIIIIIITYFFHFQSFPSFPPPSSLLLIL